MKNLRAAAGIWICLALASPANAQVEFYDNFETGDLTTWFSTTISGAGNYLVATDSTELRGTYGMHGHFDGLAGHLYARAVNATHSKGNISYWVRFSSDFDMNAASNLCQVRTSGGTKVNVFVLGTDILKIQVYNEAQTLVSNTELSAIQADDTWHLWELAYSGGASGEVVFWIDRIEQIRVTGIDYTGTAFRDIHVGAQGADLNDIGDFWIDEVILDTLGQVDTPLFGYDDVQTLSGVLGGGM